MKRAVAILILTGSAAFAQVPEPEEFRGPPYQGEVPATLTGATVIDTAEAIRLHDSHAAAFIDAYPRVKRPADLPEGTIWRQPRHMTIPGATWLYDTGYEALAPAEQQRLSDGLELISDGHKDAALVFFCRANCWMSWNTAKRAIRLGYTGVHWFPEGTDGWEQAGRDLEPANEEPAAP